MGGRGPAPKPEDERRNRSKPKAEELDAPNASSVIPKLPAKYKIARWDSEVAEYVAKEFAFVQATRRWYAAWTRSPLAGAMTEVHWLRLQEIAQIKDRWERTGDLELAKELRLQLAAFGGTPADMRRMNVTLPKSAAPKPAASPAATDDPRSNVRRLRPVDPAAAGG